MRSPTQMSAETEPRCRRGYADVAHGQLHYHEHGEGEPVILLHQTPSSSTMFQRVMRAFPAGYRLIAVDTPGFGLSDPPPRPPSSLSWYADALSGFLDALEIPRAHLVGHHTGANIAVEFAASYPARVDRLVASGLSQTVTSLQRFWKFSGITRWEPDGDGEFLQRWPMSFLPGRCGDAQAFLSELISALQAGPNYWWAYNCVFEHPAAVRAAAVSAPTLLIVVTGDSSDLRIAAGDLAERMGWPLVVLEGSSRLPFERPEEFAAAIHAHLAG